MPCLIHLDLVCSCLLHLTSLAGIYFYIALDIAQIEFLIAFGSHVFTFWGFKTVIGDVCFYTMVMQEIADAFI